MRQRGGAIANYKAAVRDIRRRRAKGLPVNEAYAATVEAAAPTPPVRREETGQNDQIRHRPWWADKEDDVDERSEAVNVDDFTMTYKGQPFVVTAWDPTRQHLVKVWTRGPEFAVLAAVTRRGWTNGKYAQVKNRKTGDA